MASWVLALATGCVGRGDEQASFVAFQELLRQGPCCPGQTPPDRLDSTRCAEVATLRIRLSAWNHARFDDLGYRLSYLVATRVGLPGYPLEEDLAPVVRCPAPEWLLPPPPPRPPPPPPPSCSAHAPLRMDPACMAACNPTCGVGRSGGLPAIQCHPKGLSWSGAYTPSGDTWGFTYQASRHRQFPNGFSNLAPPMQERLVALSQCLDRCCEAVGPVGQGTPVVDTSYARALAAGRLLVPALPNATDAIVHDGYLNRDGESIPLVYLKFRTRTPVPGVMEAYVEQLRRLGLAVTRCSLSRSCGIGPDEDRLMATRVETTSGGERVVDHPSNLTIHAQAGADGTRVEMSWAPGGLASLGR